MKTIYQYQKMKKDKMANKKKIKNNSRKGKMARTRKRGTWIKNNK